MEKIRSCFTTYFETSQVHVEGKGRDDKLYMNSDKTCWYVPIALMLWSGLTAEDSFTIYSPLVSIFNFRCDCGTI